MQICVLLKNERAECFQMNEKFKMRREGGGRAKLARANQKRFNNELKNTSFQDMM
jgi:hypothetical protein